MAKMFLRVNIDSSCIFVIKNLAQQDLANEGFIECSIYERYNQYGFVEYR